jgi:acetate kinase
VKPWVLVINAGSSSLKYQVLDRNNLEVKLKGVIERIGEVGNPANHEDAMRLVVDEFSASGIAFEDIAVVGHRIVHGGEKFNEPVLIDDKVISDIESLVPLAPLHNPAHIAGITGIRKLLSDTPQVAVFDTAFHRTIPEYANTYAIPTVVSTNYGIRKYGFHGTSHQYVASQSAAFLNQELNETSLIICHIGNGASITAVSNGRSVDTSMGLTPLEGLVMGTRSGDLDPGVIFHLHRVGKLSLSEIDDMLNKQSGLLGLAGTNDMREVWKRANEGDKVAELARQIYAYRIQKYISAYLGVLPKLSGLVFTAGVGENDWGLRELIVKPISHLGFDLDEVANQSSSKESRTISKPNSKFGIYVIPTNEEVAIAKSALALLN